MDSDSAMFELVLLDAEENGKKFEDFYLWGVKIGIPVEVLTRLKDIWSYTKELSGRVIHVGKIVIKVICDFVKNNPKYLVMSAIGLIVGALISSVPILGVVLGPLFAIASSGIGAASQMGYKDFDSFADGKIIGDAAVKKFIEFISLVFNGVVDAWNESGQG